MTVSPHEALVVPAKANIHSKPNATSPTVKAVRAGDSLRVMGETMTGWSLVDVQGKTGFILSTQIA